jgi:dihydroorotate dehydrogenase electron transfer subunit
MGVHVVVATEDGSRGERGRITLPLERMLEEARGEAGVTLYACGPTPMMRAVAEAGARFSRPVFVSLEQVMGCGMGGCYSCVVRVNDGHHPHFVRSCLEGPVFDARRVVWNELGHA